jgi:hypothetical protein
MCGIGVHLVQIVANSNVRIMGEIYDVQQTDLQTSQWRWDYRTIALGLYVLATRIPASCTRPLKLVPNYLIKLLCLLELIEARSN